MHFTLSSTVATLATGLFATHATAFVIDIYDSDNCSGNSRNVNVYDNTCADWMGSFRSYVPRAYGGAHQYAKFYVANNCGDISPYNGAWADGGDGGFQFNQCRNFGPGRSINAVGSSYKIGG